MSDLQAPVTPIAILQDPLEHLIRGAQEHGEDSDPDHEVGDLQDLLRALWSHVPPASRIEFLRCEDVKGVLDGWCQATRLLIPYIDGTWSHLFGAGKRETQVRFALDVQEKKIVAMQVEDGPGDGDWVSASAAQIADVQDSVVNANSEALEAPEDFGLERAYVLPDWAQDRPQLEEETSAPRAVRERG